MAHANRDEPLLPSFGVKLNGQPLVADVSMWVANVMIEEDLELPAMFTLELISREEEHGTFGWADEDRLALGSSIELSMGYGDDREQLIIAEITALEPTFSTAGPPTLIVRGYDKRHRLNTTRRTRSFVDQKDSDIAAQIGSDVGLTVDATDSGVTHAYVLQADQTDLEFLQGRARRMRYELAMDGETLVFRPVANADSDVVTLTLDDDLFEFRPRMSLVPLTGIQLRAWDPKEKQVITSSAKSGDEVSKMDGAQSSAAQADVVVGANVESVVRMPVMSQAEADQIALARFNNAALDFIRGDGRARGRTDIRAGRVIRLDDLGDRFSGQYYVTSAVHRYTRREGYLTDFRAQRNAS
jgi:phage protein D